MFCAGYFMSAKLKKGVQTPGNSLLIVQKVRSMQKSNQNNLSMSKKQQNS